MNRRRLVTVAALAAITGLLVLSSSLDAYAAAASRLRATPGRPRGDGASQPVQQGAQANADTYHSILISADGRYIAFDTLASDVVPGDTNHHSDVYVRDLATSTTSRVSLSTDGAQGNGDSSGSTISADGRYVAFLSSAGNLVPDDTDGLTDVFIRDRVTSVTSRVNVATGGAQANGGSDGVDVVAISGDGRHVAFESGADNLVPGDTNGARGHLRPGPPQRHDYAGQCGHGRHSGQLLQRPAGGSRSAQTAAGVAFNSTASNLVADDTNKMMDIFEHNLLTSATTRVNVATDGTQATNYSYDSVVSANGRYVAFVSQAPDYVPGSRNGRYSVYAHDLLTGVTSQINVATGGASGNGGSGHWR